MGHFAFKEGNLKAFGSCWCFLQRHRGPGLLRPLAKMKVKHVLEIFEGNKFCRPYRDPPFPRSLSTDVF